MKENYDVIVVGAGPAGIMTCYELYLKNPELEVLLIDKGHDVMNRHCPIKDKKIKQCPVHKDREPGCIPACSITDGFGGAGAYSDGKFNITSEFGGWLTDYLSNDEVEDVIHYVDNLYLKHGATKEITDPTTDKVKEIEHRGYAVGLKLLRAKVRHLGTEENLRIMTEMSNELKQHMDLQFKTAVQDIIVEDHHATGIVLENGQTIHAKKVVLAPGRDGSAWLTKVLSNQGLKLYNNQVFVADNIKEVIPEFLLLLKGVIDCPDLPLNVSRSFLQNDRDVSKISKHIVKKVADKLKSLCKNNREEYEKFWDDIQIFIKFGCLKDESFYDKVKDYILYKDINGKYITLTDYLESAKEKHENKVFYVNNVDQQSQYVKLFKDYDLNAVVLDSTIDNNFISFIEYKEMGIKFKRIDSDLSDVLKDKDNEENKEDDEKIISLFKDIIGDRVEKYLVESLKNEETPAMILVSEESRRMMEMQSRFAGMDFGMNLKEEKTLVINNNNLLVKKLVSLKDNEDKKEEINVICNQIVDLALLANKELNAEELDLFIKRSNSLMSKVISL